MSDDEKKALLKLIEECEKNGHTGNIQINWFQGKVGTVQVFKSHKMDKFVEAYI